MLKKKPQWVPDSVWAEYQLLLAMSERDRGKGSVELADLLLDSRDCAKIWAALGRRSEKYRDFVSREQEQFFKIMGFHDDAHQPHFIALVWAAKRALDLPEEEFIPSGLRRQHGSKISDLAHQLAKELEAYCPWNIRHEVAAAAGKFVEEYEKEIAKIRSENPQRYEAFFATIPLGRMRDIGAARFCEEFALSVGVNSALSAIERGAKKWASSSPLLYRAKGDSASRQYFAVKMTKYFQDVYGEKLLDVTAALVRCLLGVEIEKSAITQLNTKRVRRKLKN